MDIEERIISIVGISIIIAIILTGYLIPVSIYSYNNAFNLFRLKNGALFWDLFILVIVLFLSMYFIIRPIKTLDKKKNLTIVGMIFGAILVVLPLIIIGMSFFYSFLWMYLDGFLLLFLLGLFFYLLLLIPGVILFGFGWCQYKKFRIEIDS
jgi:hypothetical protein